jgi:hypothetical protein
MRASCPVYKITKNDPTHDILTYTITSRPQPLRPKGLTVEFIDIPQVLGFDKDEPVTTVSEDAKRKIEERRTTPRSTKKASEPD